MRAVFSYTGAVVAAAMMASASGAFGQSRSREKSRHESRHSYCPLLGMTRFLVIEEPSSQTYRCSGWIYCRDGFSSFTEQY